MMLPFHFARIPNIIFGPGTLAELYKLISQLGNKVLLVIGGSSLKDSGKLNEIERNLQDKNLTYWIVSVPSEPSPEIIDTHAQEFREKEVDVVVGIGGGSVTDAGKAISAMIPQEDSITNYLEGVGTKTHNGEKVPYIAVPTTSGTG
ncbi:MAG: iron-containing alcohol dehydrogenase, partial [Promethearchaeota archaeon]